MKHFGIALLMAVESAMVLTACGFQLRGAGVVDLPPALSKLQVRLEGNQLENHPLLVSMKNALHTQTNVQVVDALDVPRLLLFGEQSESRVLSVSAIGKVDEYLLSYEVNFRLVDQNNKMLTSPQTVKVRRDLQFDRLNPLAKEKEEQEIRREMQEDAVQQILRRLSRITPGSIRVDQR